MTLCDCCLKHCGSRGTWYDPPEEWCECHRDEFDMDDSEVVEMMIEEKGLETLMQEQGVDDVEDISPDCPRFVDGDLYGEPDPDVIYDAWRDAQLEQAW